MSILSANRRSFLFVRCLALVALFFSLPVLAHASSVAQFLGYSRPVTTIPQKGPYTSLAVDQAGNSYVYDSNQGAPIIYIVSPDGNVHIYLSASDGMVLGATPSQLSIDKTGKLYIPDPANNRVLVSTSSRTFSVLPLNAGQTLDQPTSVLTLPTGAIYILQRALGLAIYNNGNVTQLGLNDPDAGGGVIYSGMAWTPYGGSAAGNLGTIYFLNTAPGSQELLSHIVGTNFAVEVVDKNGGAAAVDSLRSYTKIGMTPDTSAITSDSYGNIYFASQSVSQLVVVPVGYPSFTDLMSYGPFLRADALAFTPYGTLNYVDSNKLLSEMGKHTVNFGPVSGTIATMYWDLSNTSFQGVGGLNAGQNFSTLTYGCGGTSGAQLGCTETVESTPQSAGAHYQYYAQSDGSDIFMRSVGLQSQLADLGTASIVYGSADYPIQYGGPNGPPATISLAVGGLAVGRDGVLYLGSSTEYNRLLELTPDDAGFYIHYSYTSYSTHSAVQLASDLVIGFYQIDPSGAIWHQVAYNGQDDLFAPAESPAPTGVAVNSLNAVLWASPQDHAIKRRSLDYNLNSFAPITFYTTPGLMPVGVFVDGNNVTYTFDSSTRQFVKILQTGDATRTAALTVSNMGGFVVLTNGTFVYVNLDTNTLHTYTAAGVDTVVGTSNSAELTLLQNGNVAGVDVSAQTVNVYPINTPVIQFATSTLGKTSSDSPKTATLTNIGLAPTTTTSHALSFGGGFTGGDDNCNAIAVSMTCTSIASFKPNFEGINTVTNTVTTSSQLNPFILTYTGRGALADHLVITGPASVAAGTTNSFAVTAYNADNTVSMQFHDTVHFTIGDPQVTAPANQAFDGYNGYIFANPQFRTAGTQTFTATDTINPGLTFTYSVTVTAGTPNQVSSDGGGQQSVPVGGSFAPFGVVIADAYGNHVPGAVVTFTPGAGCVFKNGNTATTDANGVAMSPVCTATGTTGTFNVSINTPGLPTPFVYTETTTGFSGIPAAGPVAFLGAQHINPADPFVSPSGMVVNNKGLTYVYDANVTGPSPIIYTVTQDGIKTPYLTAADGLNMSSRAGAQLTVDASGKLYIPDPIGNLIYVSSAAHTVTAMNITGLASPESIVVPASGTTYVLQSNGLYTLAGSTLTKVTFTDPDGNTNPSYIGMALNRQGKLFLLNDTFGELLVYDTTAHTAVKVYDNTTSIGGLMPTTLNGDDMLTVDNEGYAYSGDFANGRIIKSMPDGSTYQVYTGIKSIAATALSVNPSGSIAYTDYVAKTLGNVSDSFADLSAAASNNSTQAVLYFNSSVQLNYDAGTFGSNVSTFLDIHNPNSCFAGATNPGYCQAGVVLNAAPAGSYSGYEAVGPAAGGTKIYVPLFATNRGSALVDLMAPVLSYGSTTGSSGLGGTFAGSTGSLAVDGSGTIYTSASSYTAINAAPAGLLKIGGNHTPSFSSLSSPLPTITPSLLAIDGKGTLYYTDSTNAIYSTDIQTFATPATVVSPGTSVSGLAVDARGLLLYAAAGKVVRYDPAFSSNPSTTLYNAAGAKPQGLSVDINNTANFFDANIKKFVSVLADGTVKLSPAVSVNNISNLLVMPSGMIIYIDIDNGVLHSFTPAGVDTVIGYEVSAQLAFLPNGDFAAINTATQELDVFPITRPTITFNPVTVGKTGTDSPRLDIFTNVGASPTGAFTSMYVNNGASYTYTNNTCGASLAPLETCSVTESYTPQTIGVLQNGGSFSFSIPSQSVNTFTVQSLSTGLGAISILPTYFSYPTAGVPSAVTINAAGSDHALFTGYRGTVHYSSNDPAAVLPADHTFTAADGGVYSANITWKTAGVHTFTITETAPQGPGLAILTDTESVTVVGGAAKSISIVSGNNQSQPIGQPYVPFTVQAVDAYGNPSPSAQVNFNSGTGCIFQNNVTTYQAVTNDSGTSTSPICTAGSTPGVFQVSAVLPAVASVNFTITNTKVTPALIVNVPGVAFGVASAATVTEVVDPSSLPGATGTAYYAFDATPNTGSSNVSVVNGTENIPIPANLTVGTHILRVLYNGDVRYQPNTGSQSFTVTKQNIWVVNSNFSLSELSNSGAAISGTSGYFGVSTGIGIDAQGTVWTGTIGGSAVTGFSKAGVSLNTYAGAGVNSPVAIAISGAGSIWIANSGGTVSAISKDGGTLSPATGFDGGGLNTPSSIAIDASGNVWVTNSGDSSLTEFIGAAEPAVTPLATAAKYSTQGAKP